MQATQFVAIAAALAVSSAFATPSSGANAVKVTAPKTLPTGVATAPHSSTQPVSTTGGGIRINPQPLPPNEDRVGAKPTRAGGDPPTVIDRR